MIAARNDFLKKIALCFLLFLMHVLCVSACVRVRVVVLLLVVEAKLLSCTFAFVVENSSVILQLLLCCMLVVFFFYAHKPNFQVSLHRHVVSEACK